ncbi:MAG: AMP-binding protein, partial [Ilumatobacteraceae bacterium]
GTTGRPKGAVRSSTGGADSLAPLLSTVPVRARDTVVVAAPLFHAWGLAHLGMGLALSSTLVLDRRFDPSRTVAAVARHRAAGLVVVPVMLRRILDLEASILDGYDTSSLRYIASSGSALGAPLATAALDRFGPVLYNVYGSTEVSLATIAGPADLAAAPGTAGRQPPGSTLRIVDEAGRLVPVETTGRIFVGNSSRFDGYTGGGGKESIDGLLSIGDLGHFDTSGRLFIDGRDDEMIVSGGENVYPAEVEELLAAHSAVLEAAVVGVDDDELGQRLVAFVVRRPRARVTAEQLRSHVRDQLARHKVPKAVHFVNELPRTTTGKVRKRDLGGPTVRSRP